MTLELVAIEFAFLGFGRINFVLSNGMESHLNFDKIQLEAHPLPTEFKHQNKPDTQKFLKDPIKSVEMFYAASRKGYPITGLAFYDKFGREILQIGKSGYANKTLTLADDEKIIGFRSSGKFMSLEASQTHF